MGTRRSGELIFSYVFFTQAVFKMISTSFDEKRTK